MADTDVYEFQALMIIRSGNVVAFQPGDLVPAETVAELDLEAAGMVRRIRPPRGRLPEGMAEAGRAAVQDEPETGRPVARRSAKKGASRERAE